METPTVNTAKATVPMMNHSELRCFNMNGLLAPCCVNDDSHFGRAIDVATLTTIESLDES